MKRKKFGLLAVLFVAYFTGAPIIQKVAAAVPQIAGDKDERALAALDKAVDFYGKQPSFSLVGRETLSADDEIVRRTIFEFRAQRAERASLKVSIVDESGKVLNAVSARLLGADSVWVQSANQTAQIRPIHTAREREDAFVELTNSLPALGLSVGAFLLKTNPLRTPFVLSASYAKGESNSEIVTTRAQAADNPTIVQAIYTLDAASGALRTLEARVELENTTVTILTEFEALIPNGKSSQASTDEAVYNWEAIAAPVVENKVNEGNKSAVSVDPAARVAFERAAKLYRDLDGLHLAWKQIEADEDGEKSGTAALDYKRDGRLRLQYPGILSSLVVIDGAIKWTLQSEWINPAGPPRYERVELADDEKAHEAFFAMMVALELPHAVGELLNPDDLPALHPLVVSSKSNIDGFISFEARMLESQQWNGETCDLVQIIDIDLALDEDGNLATPKTRDVRQSVHWFARSDGRLMRLQESFRSGDDAGSTTDSQITEQTFDPNFAPATFKFVPPADAVLAKE